MQWTPEGRRLVTGASSGEFTLWNGLTFNFETILQVCSLQVYMYSKFSIKLLLVDCSLGIGNQKICRLTFDSLCSLFYSDVEPLSKYSPIMLHLYPATRIVNKHPALGPIYFMHVWGQGGLHERVALI